MKELAIKLGEWESCLGELVAKDKVKEMVGSRCDMTSRK